MRKSMRQPYKQFFGTLANQYRIDIIETLVNGPLSVMKICEKMNSNQTTVSHNLKRLEHCGFLTVKPNGRERIYQLNEETIKPLLTLMHQHMTNHCSKITR